MDKLKLDLEKLEVQTFETSADPARKAGTVFGFATWANEDSCHATYCGDCDVTETCNDDNTNYCDSVNIANCASAFYSDCCDNGSGGTFQTDYDPWKWNCS